MREWAWSLCSISERHRLELRNERSRDHIMIARREVELKLQLDMADIDMFVAAPFLANVKMQEQVQTSVYFDTPEHAVRKIGLSLRVRTVGKQRLQTLKAESMSAAGLFARPEWEMPIRKNQPVIGGRGNPLPKLITARDLRRLAPIFRIVVTRKIYYIEKDGAKIELVLDQGEIVADYESVSICEVELELKAGLPAPLFSLARALNTIVQLQLSSLSKAQLGYQMLEGNVDKPVKWTPPPLKSDMTTSEGFEAIAHACIRQFRLNQSILARIDSPEALHQARVALRRLRSALSIFEAVVTDNRSDHLMMELRWIAGELDRARNLDVLLERLTDHAAQVPLKLARKYAYAAATAALGSPRLKTLMFDLVEWITIGNWRAERSADMAGHQLDKFAVAALGSCRRHVKRRGRHWKRLDDKARHKLRIQAKKLRYAADFFGMLFPTNKAVRRHKIFLEVLRELQAKLGDLNDRITGAALLAELGLPDVKITTTAKGKRHKRKAMLEDALKAYRALIDAQRFWR